MKKIVLYLLPLIFSTCQSNPEGSHKTLPSQTLENSDTIKETAVRETQEISDSNGSLNVFSADSLN